MSSCKGSPSNDLQGCMSDPDSQPSNLPPWHVKQGKPASTRGSSEAVPSASATSTTRATQHQAQREAWNLALNGGKTKSQGSPSNSTLSSSTDGGVRLDIEYSPIQKRRSPVQKDPSSTHSPMAEPSDVQSQASSAILPQNASDGRVSDGGVSNGRVSDRSSSDLSPQTRIPSAQLSDPIQATFDGIMKKLERSANVPQATKDMLSNRLTNLFRDMREVQKRGLTCTMGECDQLKEQLTEARQVVNAVIQDRMRITAERDTLQLRINKLDLEPKKIVDGLRESVKELKQQNEYLLERVRMQDEKLMGKRALWTEANPTSVSRRRAMNAFNDPFNSPLPAQNSGIGRSSHAEFNSPSPMPPIYSWAGLDKVFDSPNPGSQRFGTHAPPSFNRRGSRRRRNLPGYNPTGYAPKTRYNPGTDPFEPSANLRRYNTEPADYFAMVPFTPEEDRYLKFKTGIGHVYHLVEDWAKAYADMPDFEKDQVIAKSNKQLWDYMMNCTYPGHRLEANAHVVMLLSDSITRILLLTRMAVTYCIQDIMSVDAFRAFSQPVAEAIEDAKNRLQERGLANDARQTLIDRQVEAIQAMVDSPIFAAFRIEQLNIHTTRLRDMLGPLLNRGCDRAQAGKELGLIAVASWDLAIKMYTSHLSFQVYFPETTTKFNPSTMVATDKRVDPAKMHMQQAHIKLVITPVITMRDDRGTTIKVKNLHMASVLLWT